VLAILRSARVALAVVVVDLRAEAVELGVVSGLGPDTDLDVSRLRERGPVAGRDRLTIEEVVRRVLRDAPAGRAGEVGPQQQD
jgi:hypothetical protein